MNELASNFRTKISQITESADMVANRTWLANITIGLFLLFMSFSFCAFASDRSYAPTSLQIENLLRESLSDGRTYVPLMYRKAVLKKFKLLKLEGISQSRWYAKIELLFDFGRLPPTIVGFERLRSGRYWLAIQAQGKRLVLTRFSPISEIHLLPAKI